MDPRCGNRAGLLLEPGTEVRVYGDVRRQHLDGDAAFEPRVARLVYLPHAARTEEADELIRSEASAEGQGHERRVESGRLYAESQPAVWIGQR